MLDKCRFLSDGHCKARKKGGGNGWQGEQKYENVRLCMHGHINRVILRIVLVQFVISDLQIQGL